ncbi:MAG: leucine--tRNA ligase [Bdellovibrionaceae bacterium]|nr:leucine--tRNA ligase [Pseudobdellovibrionaceae bacterium]MBE8233702.1 leucine--tRNA ligase [Endozoicomonadaceae bacterium]
MVYNCSKIEKKWQDKWAAERCFEAEDNSKKPKYYALDMFPYPSGYGLHVGHIASYTPADVLSRYKRSLGFNVLHPIGYDAFGLPAEQHAIQTGVHPEETTKAAIENFKRQLQSFGFSFDWSREISTCDKDFYKWTQYIFLILLKKGLAYQKEVPVNWCPGLKTVLANEEVVDGKSERGGHPVFKKPMKQWMLKITDYAEELLNDLDTLDWPQKTKDMQRHWIGKSVGANICFKTENTDDVISVFTTRPDTIFGVSFIVLAPEHLLSLSICTEEKKQEVKTYIEKASSISELDRKSNTIKQGVFTGTYAVHPLTKKLLPIWIADYVLMDYGSGAIMAVPAHDQRDYDFATKYQLDILPVLKSNELKTTLPFTEEGSLINSKHLNGLSKTAAITEIIKTIEEKKIGKKEVQYKLRDWLFSRQRYWGEPFPVVHTNGGQCVGVSHEELPVSLPQTPNYEPTDTGEAPLARIEEFVNYSYNGITGKRETDTMPGSAGSSWYFLRYTDPHNNKEAFSFDKQKYWMPVDLYVGGSEHSVGHLLYSRFWQKVLFNAGLSSYKEPFKKLVHQGVVIGPDGQRMSKSKGNVVSADDVKNNIGADATRAYICFMGPFEKDKLWNSDGAEGIKKFLERYYRLCLDEKGNAITENLSPNQISPLLLKLYHKTVKKVGQDIETMNFNTALSSLMVLTNQLYKENVKPHFILQAMCQLLMPFTPHLSEEIWERLGQTGLVSLAQWPKYDEELTKENSMQMGVQVNGKMRGLIEVTQQTSQEEAVKKAETLKPYTQALQDKKILKIIYKPGKILNIITSR